MSELSLPAIGPFDETSDVFSVLALQILSSRRGQAESVEESLNAYCSPEEIHGRQTDQGNVSGCIHGFTQVIHAKFQVYYSLSRCTSLLIEMHSSSQSSSQAR